MGNRWAEAALWRNLVSLEKGPALIPLLCSLIHWEQPRKMWPWPNHNGGSGRRWGWSSAVFSEAGDLSRAFPWLLHIVPKEEDSPKPAPHTVHAHHTTSLPIYRGASCYPGILSHCGNFRIWWWPIYPGKLKGVEEKRIRRDVDIGLGRVGLDWVSPYAET